MNFTVFLDRDSPSPAFGVPSSPILINLLYDVEHRKVAKVHSHVALAQFPHQHLRRLRHVGHSEAVNPEDHSVMNMFDYFMLMICKKFGTSETSVL